MKKFRLINKYFDEEVTVALGSYSNGRPAIQINDVEGFPVMVATVNKPDVHLEEDEVIIKDYSENEGVLQFLEDNNIVHATPLVVQVGHTYCKICILQPEDKWAGFEEPVPVAYQEDGKKKWVIDGYNIWATTYEEALSHYGVIKSL